MNNSSALDLIETAQYVRDYRCRTKTRGPRGNDHTAGTTARVARSVEEAREAFWYTAFVHSVYVFHLKIRENIRKKYSLARKYGVGCTLQGALKRCKTWVETLLCFI